MKNTVVAICLFLFIILKLQINTEKHKYAIVPLWSKYNQFLSIYTFGWFYLPIAICRQKLEISHYCILLPSFSIYRVHQSVPPKQRGEKPFASIFPTYTQWFGGACASLKACPFLAVLLFLLLLLELNLMTDHQTHVLLEHKLVSY